jgi:hypothetical protein
VQADTCTLGKEFNLYNKSNPDLAPILDPGPHLVSYKLAHEILINTGRSVNADDFAVGYLFRYGIQIRNNSWIKKSQ